LSVVCIDCRYINGRPSGIAEMVAALVAHVPQMAPDLRFRLLVSPNAPGRLSEAPNVEHLVVRAAANGPATMWWLPHAADLRGVALFHATFNIMPAGLAMPCLTTIHDLMWLEKPEWCETGWKRPVRQAFFRHGITRALDHSALLATVSAATRDAIIAARPDVAPRLFVTPSGVSDAFRPVPVDRHVMSGLGIAPGRRFVLTVGQLAPYKNHEGALRAFALVCKGRDDIDLVFVQRQGRGAQSLLALAVELGIAGRVRILPAQKQDDLIQLYASAALLLHPSLCEGFGHPLGEAMACGCPVVTSDRSAMPEVTADAALLVDPTDPVAIAAAIGRILDDPSLARAMRQRGLERAAALRWDDFARSNLALYRRALAGR
jgi:alpha-1,3-rhamnosyl/mannosyltransferase